MTRKYQIQVRGIWAGADGNHWRPAVSGALNQTGRSDADASTFDVDDKKSALALLDDFRAATDWRKDAIGQIRKTLTEFRVIEVDR